MESYERIEVFQHLRGKPIKTTMTFETLQVNDCHVCEN